jgi:uncharacterized protein Yka (UPF0111/DUF47 family)
MLDALLPKGAPFFELLLQQNDMLCKMASLLVDMLAAHDNIEEPHSEISRLEDEADALNQAITWHLSQTFITPIDREDILHINKEQEEAIDLFHDVANRVYIFDLRRVRFPMLHLSRKLNSMVTLTNSMLLGLSKKKDSHNTKCFRSLRSECEMLASMGLVELFDIENPTVADVFEILKWSQAYDHLEFALRRVIRLAEVIEEAVLKNV